MMRERFLTVPKNVTGIQEYNLGVEESDNLYLLRLPENEFVSLIPCFSKINAELGLLIDDYKSEVIENKYLNKCQELVEELEVDVPVFSEALRTAIEYKTILALDF